ERARDGSHPRRAGPAVRAGRGPRGEHLPGADADPRDDAHLHPEDRRDHPRARAVRPVDAAEDDQLHDRALRIDSGRDALSGREPMDVEGRTGPGGIDALLAMSLPRAELFPLALARIAGLFLIAPIFGSQSVPVRVRAALVLFIAIAMLPVLPADAAAPL